jgi:Ca2+/H+ antiporter
MIVGYAFSPIDLIPDFIPIIGYLDDFVFIPLGVLLALKMIPEPVMVEYRVKVVEKMSQEGYQNWVAGVVIIIVWILVLVLIFLMVKKYLPGEIFG